MKIKNRADLTKALERREALNAIRIAEKRDWTDAEDREVSALNYDIDNYKAAVQVDSHLAGHDHMSLNSERSAPGRQSAGAVGRKPRMMFRDQSNGQLVSALRPDEAVHAGGDGPAFSDYLHAAMGNTEAQHRVSAALSTNSAAAGGFFVPETISRQFIDLARARSAVIGAGCQTIVMNSADLKIVRLASDAVPEWRGELQNITMSRPAFGAINIIPKSLGVTAIISRELVEDGQNAAMQAEAALMAAMGQALDLYCLRGTADGAGPTGLRYQGINVLDYDDLVSPRAYRHASWALRKIYDANYPGDASGLSWIIPPVRQELYDSAVDSTWQPLNPPATVAKLKQVVSNQIPGNLGDGTQTEEYFGDFSECAIFMRTGIELKVSDSAALIDEDNEMVSVFSKNALAIRATLRADFVCFRPTWFSVVINLPDELILEV